MNDIKAGEEYQAVLAELTRAARYKKLIATLRPHATTLEAATDDKARLSAGWRALQGVIGCLLEDPEVRDARLARPLSIIENAIYDAGEGSKEIGLLNHETPDGKRANYLVREEVQGSLALALDVMIWSEMKDAADWVEDQATKAGIRCANGSRLSVEQIKRWRNTISDGTAPAGAIETFDKLLKTVREIHEGFANVRVGQGSEKDRKRSEAFAIAVINWIADHSPQAAPNRNTTT